MASSLEVDGLTKRFGGLVALNKCTLTVEEGTITGLIGPNGAGKTTLFNVITGFYKPEEGQILYNGDEIQGLPPHEIFRKGIVRTFQVSRELKNMTVFENLKLVPANQPGEDFWNAWFRPNKVGGREEEISRRAEEVMDYVDLTRLKDEKASNLSGGQKKLLELGRTMMADPDMILLDEPGAGINPTLMKKLSNYIVSLKEEQGITFLLIEHDMDLVMNLCEPIIVLSSGEKLMEGTAAEVQKDKEVLDAYLGR